MGFVHFKRHVSLDSLKDTDFLKDRKKLIIALVLTKVTSQVIEIFT